MCLVYHLISTTLCDVVPKSQDGCHNSSLPLSEDEVVLHAVESSTGVCVLADFYIVSASTFIDLFFSKFTRQD